MGHINVIWKSTNSNAPKPTLHTNLRWKHKKCNSYKIDLVIWKSTKSNPFKIDRSHQLTLENLEEPCVQIDWVHNVIWKSTKSNACKNWVGYINLRWKITKTNIYKNWLSIPTYTGKIRIAMLTKVEWGIST